MYIVGKVLKPHGLKGEVKAEIITSFPEHFNNLAQVYIDEKGFSPLTIEFSRLAREFVYLKFKSINSRNEAETLRGLLLYIPESELHHLDIDEFYIHDLIGLQVFSENAAPLGVIVDVENYPANDVYVVRNKLGIEHRIPAIKDVIKKVDITSGKVTVRILEGLFE